MIQKIGKYQIIERVGRGGMGTVLKAHDPVLDRTVALKVISDDLDVTNELRARFFREAQACARLSHPNIITVYDLADLDGRLFIVMEFLEGEELKKIIAQKRALSLEQKLSVMVQVCSGLAYAHQRGIVHRDIKPGNIFLLNTGTAKILDFGIARIMSLETSLTRTGLVMGTLRYMAPEQARGRGDQRSDIFSVGAVFYELLAYRPAFPGEDPIQIIEALRDHEPVPPHELDRAIPPDLSDAIMQTLKKDPAERVQALGDLRRTLEAVERRFTEEADRLREHLRRELQRVRQLQLAAEEQIGDAFADETLPLVDDAGGLSALQAVEQQVARRRQALEGVVERAASLESALHHGWQLLRSAHHQDAIAEFERVVDAIPEHARARQALAQAQAGLEEARRRRERLAAVLSDAKAAFENKDFAGCLGTLDALDQPETPADIAAEADDLRRRAEAARAAQEDAERRQAALRRERERASRVREHLDELRRAAEEVRAAENAAVSWEKAEDLRTKGEASFAEEAYRRATQEFEEALGAYRRAVDESRTAIQARRQKLAMEARERAERARRQAEELRAPTFAATDWAVAATKNQQGTEALERREYTAAGALFADACRTYEQAAEVARRENARRGRERAAQSQQRMDDARRQADGAGARARAESVWSEAEARRAEGTTALSQSAFAAAGERFDEAHAAYVRALADTRAALLAEEQARTAAEQVRQELGQARARAVAVSAARYAAPRWGAAIEQETQAKTAYDAKDYQRASTLFGQARQQYERAEETARAAKAEEDRQADETARDAARLLDAGRHPEALARAEEALAINPDHALAARVLEQARTAIDEAREARAAIERTFAEGQARLASGDVDGAIDLLLRVLERDAAHLGAIQLLDDARGRRQPSRERQAGTPRTEETVVQHRPTVPADREPMPLTGPGRAPGAQSPPDEATRLISQAEDSTRESIPAGRQRAAPVGDPASARGRPLGMRVWALGVVSAAAVGLVVLGAYQALRAPARVADRVPAEQPAASRPGSSAPVATAPVPGPSPDPLVAAKQAVETLQGQVVAARTEAESADARRLAAKTFRSAAETEQRAEAALGSQSFDAARADFSQALESYRAAAAEARQAAEAARESEAKQQEQAAQRRRAAETARGAATNARASAEKAGADRAAGGTFARAEQQAREAQAALARDDGSAEQRFKAAERQYLAATEEARSAAETERQRRAVLQRQQAEAEDLRDRAAATRRQAEQAGGDRYAASTMAAARAKEQSGQAALGRADWPQASSAFRGAQAEFQTAAQEARRDDEAERRRQASLQQEVQQLRNDVAARRDQALKGEADVLVKDVFSAGQTREREGDRLFAAQNPAGARQPYQDALDRYDEALRGLSAARLARTQADQERSRMLGEKQRARTDAPEFNGGVAQERQGTATYQRGAFKAATDNFKAAADLFAKAAVPRSEPRPPFMADPSLEVKAALDEFRRAYEARDVAWVQRVRPGLPPAELYRLRETFENAASYKMELRIDTIEIRGNEAVARGFRQDVLTAKDGQIHRTESRPTFTLKKARDRWTIDAIK
jgi:serine/threonine-protein kinase